MRGINELAEHDAKWRTIALRITGSKITADDLVQDMYLKLMDKDKEINDYYVTMTLKSIFIDGIRKSKMFPLFDSVEVKDESVPFEPTDEEREILNKIKALPYKQQEFIAESYDHSLREIQNIYNINYGFIYRELHKGLDAVLGDAKEQLYNNSNMKIRKAKKK
tara:strand:- start:131 stop:622 length:492 start_codon:yes stop_codon:yes gene_type:complete